MSDAKSDANGNLQDRLRESEDSRQLLLGLLEDQNRSDDALRESESRLRAILDSALDGIITIDHQGRIVELNPSAERMFELSPGSATGRLLADVAIPPSLRKAHKRGLACLLETGESKLLGRRVETTAWRADGTEFPVELTVTRINTDSPALFTGHVRDLSDQKRAEHDLRVRDQAIATSVMPAVFGDANHVITYANRAFLDLFGFESLEQVLGMPNTRFESQPTSVVEINEAMEEHGSWTGEIISRKLDGTPIELFLSATLIRDEAGRPASSLATFLNITERKLAEQALRESEQRFRSLAESLPISVSVAQDGRRVFGNRRSEELTGYSHEELIGRQSGTLTHPDYRERMLQQLTDCLEKGTAGRQENKIVRKDGQERWVDFSTTMVDWNGRPATLGAGIDITERKESEQALRKSEEQYRAMFELASVGMVQTTPTGQFLRTNARLSEMFGYTADELRNMTFSEITHPDDRAADLAQFQRVVRGELPAHMIEKRYVRKDGKVIWGIANAVIVRDAQGQPLLAVAVVSDITERKLAEAELRESMARQQLIIKSANIGLWDWNLITDEVFYSSEWKSQLGYADDELADTFEEWESRLHPDDREQALATTQEFLAEQRQTLHSIEFRLQHRDGSWRWILALADLQRNATGEPTRMMGCHVDITERKRAETTLREIQREVLQIADGEQRRIGQDLHDSVQQDLAGLGMLAQALLDTLDKPAAELEALGARKPRDLAEMLIDGITRATQGLRTISHGLIPIQLDTEGLVDAISELAARTDDLDGITCVFKCEQPVRIADGITATHLYRIAQEAVTNALKHANPEHILLALELDDGRPVLKIADDGVGLDPGRIASGGIGVKTMNYRAGLIGAAVTVHPVESGGTLVICRISEDRRPQ